MTAKSPQGLSRTRVVRLLNSVVDVCLVYGIDETSTRELQVNEEGDIHSCYDSLLQRDIKVHFLQILAPGQIYPERATQQTGVSSPRSSFTRSNSEATSPCPEDSIAVTHCKRFKVEDLGLTWETVETVHWFIFPEGPQMYPEDQEPSIIPMMLTNIDGARSYATGIRFTRPFFVQKLHNAKYYTLIPWKSSMQPPPNSRLVFLPTCCVLVSQFPYFQLMKDALSGLHRLMSNDEDEMVDFWEVIKDYTERLFLIPSPPQGLLAVEFQLPAFSSSLLVRPPRGDNQYLDIRLNYPFLCLSVDAVLQVVSALLTEQRLIFLSSLYPMLTYTIECFLTYISPFNWRHPCVPILPHQLTEYLEAPGTNIMGVHASIADTPEFQQVDDCVIIDLDSGTVTCRLNDPPTLPLLPQHAVDLFKLRYEQLSKRKFMMEEMQRLSHLSSEERERERSEFNHQMDEALCKMFLEMMVNVYHNICEQLVHGRLKYEETVKEMCPEDQEFYKYATCTDMFSAFYQGRRLRTHRDDFTLLAEKMKKLQIKRKSIIPPEEENLLSPTISIPSCGSLRTSSSTGSIPGIGSPRVGSPRMRTTWSSPHRHLPTTPLQSLGIQSLFPEDSILMRSSPVLSSVTASVIPSPPTEMLKLELPPLGENKPVDRVAFINEVITSLSEMMQNKIVQAQCVYLRGFYRICKREYLEALDDFYDTLQRLEIQLVPDYKLLQNKVVAYLSEDQQEEIKSRKYHKMFIQRKTAVQSGCRRQASVSHNLISLEKKMPKNPLNLTEFMKIVNQNNIAKDAESATNLFRVLSHGRTTNIDPQCFAQFYEAWKLVLQDNDSVELPGLELEKEEEVTGRVQERVLAVSPLVRTNFGIQSQLVLTTFRLLVVTSFKTYVMADCRKPIRFENCDLQLGILGSKTPGIRLERLVKDKVSKPDTERSSLGRFTHRARGRGHDHEMYMGFQDVMDRDNWYRMVVEMQTGWKLSVARKDPCIMETAECHVILQNVVSQSGLLDRCNYSQRIKVSMKLLSFSSKDVAEVSKITVEALQYRINPCLHETERQTVESLLYIPPTDLFEEGQGKLWIGLGNGRLKVYDMEARCFESDIKITESRHGKSVRLSCLLLVDKHVWVGSFSRNIHILDAETVCHVSQLSYLEDAPRDLALSQVEPRLVWSLLLNGVVLAWDPETRSRVAKIQVPMSDDHTWTTCTCFTIWREQVWVGTNRGTIAVMDSTDGTCLQLLFFPGGRKRQVEIKHLALSNENEVWCSVYAVPRSEDSTFIAVFDPQSREKKLQYNKLDNRVSIILPVNNTMWCGTKSGKIYIFHARTYAEGKGMPKVLSAHDDFIRTMAMTSTEIDLVVSGSGSNDGYAAVWKAIEIP